MSESPEQQTQQSEKRMGLDQPFVAEHTVPEGEDLWHPPSRKYPIEGKTGRLIFITAPSGMGKTTTAHKLRENHDFVFYEGDCFLGGAETFPAQSPAGPFGAHWFGGRGTRLLVNLSPERVQASKQYFGIITKDLATTGQLTLEIPEDIERPILSMLCDDVRKHFTEMKGGYDMVVTFVVYSRKSRQFVSEKLADLGMKWVVLNGTEELNKARILKRDGDMLRKMRAKKRDSAAEGSQEEKSEEQKEKDLQEDAAAVERELQHRLKGWEPFSGDLETEPNTVGIELKDEMSADAVAQLIVDKVSAF